MKKRTRALVTLSLVAVVAAAVALTAKLTTSPSNPLMGLSRPAPADAKFVATVEERLSAGRYHYLRVRAVGRESLWLVATQDAPIGQTLDIEVFGISAHFTSARLAKDFSPLSFATIHPHLENP
jgi:hypothetical protein